jgi:hypothetical protein
LTCLAFRILKRRGKTRGMEDIRMLMEHCCQVLLHWQVNSLREIRKEKLRTSQSQEAKYIIEKMAKKRRVLHLKNL